MQCIIVLGIYDVASIAPVKIFKHKRKSTPLEMLQVRLC